LRNTLVSRSMLAATPAAIAIDSRSLNGWGKTQAPART
jgi:hypothetical protein